MPEANSNYDVLIVGGGAAGLMTSILLARQCRDLKIVIVDGAKRLGAKILISGGGRCNVTNRSVVAKDFNGGSRSVIKRVLKTFSAKATADFFESIGVPLHEEQHGKLFPDSNKARHVLEALIEEAESLGVCLMTGCRAENLEATSRQFKLFINSREFGSSEIASRAVVLATGGQSVPETGSDGFGYELAKRLGHSALPTFPALAPLLLDDNFHEQLSGISLEVELSLHTANDKPIRFTGSMLWTHFGISGPVVLDLSRHWHSANLVGAEPVVRCNFLPEFDSQRMESEILDWNDENPTGLLSKKLSQHLPRRFVEALFQELQISSEATFSQFPKQQRRNLVRNLIERILPVTDSRGFRYAEATAGGIPLNEVEPATLQSRTCDKLFFVGEILDVDGRLGGFNFQWAWSSAAVAAQGLASLFASSSNK